MGYVQITLNDWLEMKQKLKRELLGVKKSFVRIGFVLRQIDDQRLYEQDGYKSIAEFAKAEYGLEQSTISKFMSINREYSVDGYSETLRPEFEDFNRSQLEEMLKLPDQDREMIQKETQRDDIRQLKKFNKSGPEEGTADDIRQLAEKFYEDNPEILRAAFDAPEFDEQTMKQFAEMVNPGGNRSYKKGMFFMMMYENRVAVKKFGSSPRDMTWMEFYLITKDIIGGIAADPKTWEKYFGKEENAPAHKSEDIQETKASNESGTDESDTEPDNGTEPESVPEEKNSTIGEPELEAGMKESEAAGGEAFENDIVGEADSKEAIEETAESERKRPQEEYAPAHKSEEEAVHSEESDDIKPETAAVTEEQLPRQMEIRKDFPEYCPEGMENTEPVKEAYTCRLLYMASKGYEEASAYMAETMEQKIRKMKNVSFNVLTEAGFWEGFFNAEVDKEGREIECV